MPPLPQTREACMAHSWQGSASSRKEQATMPARLSTLLGICANARPAKS